MNYTYGFEEPLATRLRAFAAKEDELILPDLQKAARGDAAGASLPKWQNGYAAGTLANQAMFCLARFEQTKKDIDTNLRHLLDPESEKKDAEAAAEAAASGGK